MLKIEAASKTFGSGVNAKTALDRVSLKLGTGEFLTVIGGNGAGKSTLFNCVAGVYSLDSGRILLDGEDITYSPEYQRSRQIGRVFQDPMRGTAFDMSIAENMAIAYLKGRRIGLGRGISPQQLTLFREKLSLLDLGLEDRMGQKVGLLSGGQRQALTLLMATLVKPKLLLLDEHTAALDPSIARKVMQITGEIVAEEQLSTIMITHNMKSALTYGTRTMMMHEGRIILDIQGSERENMTVEGLIQLFGKKSGADLDNDRMLLI